MLYNPDITHISDTLFRPNETAFDRTQNRKLSFTPVYNKTSTFFLFSISKLVVLISKSANEYNGREGFLG